MRTTFDVIVVGGGVVGLTVARQLARDGFQTALVERHTCGREASWAGAGILAPRNPHAADALTDLRRRSLALFGPFCADLLSETGIDPEYDACGAIDVCLTDQDLRVVREDAAASAGRVTADGKPVLEVIPAEQVRQLEPMLTPNLLAALLYRETATVRNPRLLQALQASCCGAGGSIHEHAPVEHWLFDGDRVRGVVTPQRTLVADHVVLCAGAWSPLIGEQLGTLIPGHPVRGQMVLMKFDAPPLKHVIQRGKVYLVPRRDGHVLLGATEEHDAGFDKRCTAKGVGWLIEKGIELAPALADAPVVATWSGLRPASKDNAPYIGPVPGMPGLIAATGHFRSGLTLAPVTAEAVSAMIRGQTYEVDLSACAPGRPE